MSNRTFRTSGGGGAKAKVVHKGPSNTAQLKRVISEKGRQQGDAKGLGREGAIKEKKSKKNGAERNIGARRDR